MIWSLKYLEPKWAQWTQLKIKKPNWYDAIAVRNTCICTDLKWCLSPLSTSMEPLDSAFSIQMQFKVIGQLTIPLVVYQVSKNQSSSLERAHGIRWDSWTTKGRSTAGGKKQLECLKVYEVHLNAPWRPRLQLILGEVWGCNPLTDGWTLFPWVFGGFTGCCSINILQPTDLCFSVDDALRVHKTHGEAAWRRWLQDPFMTVWFVHVVSWATLSLLHWLFFLMRMVNRKKDPALEFKGKNRWLKFPFRITCVSFQMWQKKAQEKLF